MASGMMTITGMFGVTKNQETMEATPVVEIEALTKPLVTTAPLHTTLEFDATPNAPVEFWEKLAVCETDSNWKDTGKYAGGLGIYTKGKFPHSNMGTWERYGGEEFAPSPDKATKRQQIIVADRISVEGWRTIVVRDADKARRMGVPQEYVWEQKPVGFTGWGCYKSKSTGRYRMARPKLFHYDPKMVPIVQYTFDQRGPIVRDLQTLIGVTVDGHYGKKTREAHIKYLKHHKLPLIGVGQLPVSTADIKQTKS